MSVQVGVHVVGERGWISGFKLEKILKIGMTNACLSYVCDSLFYSEA